MSQNNLAYPYPVLTAYSDDVQPALNAQNVQVGEMQIINNDYVLALTLVLEDQQLLKLIEEEKAEYMFDVNCPTSLYRRCINSKHNEVKIDFPFKRVSGVAKIRPYVIAKTAFTYQNPTFHPDYGNESFEIEEGDVLAIFNEITYDFEIDYNQLKAFSSIMFIRKAEDENEKDIHYIMDEPKIVIILPVDKFAKYNQFKADPQYTNAVHASLAQNALLAVLMQTNWNDEDSQEPLWKRTIRYRVAHEEELMPYKDLNNQENLVIIAQKLLGDPIQRMFDDFAKEE